MGWGLSSTSDVHATLREKFCRIVQIQEIHYSLSLGALKVLEPSSLGLIFSSGKDVCEVMLQLALSDFYLSLQKVA